MAFFIADGAMSRHVYALGVLRTACGTYEQRHFLGCLGFPGREVGERARMIGKVIMNVAFRNRPADEA